MSLYFFDIEEDGVIQVDTAGSYLETATEAQTAALELLPDLAHNYMLAHNTFSIRVSVRGPEGSVFMRVKVDVQISPAETP